MTTAVAGELTDETVLSKLRDVVAKRPDYVYSPPEHMKDEIGSCFYAHTDDEDGFLVSAGCAVGVVLAELGVPLEKLAAQESIPAYRVLGVLAPRLSKRAKDVLNDMQTYQDTGLPWGQAYAQATGVTI
ncbi:hypothetical protein [Streptomyces sp. NPDC046939]|uniref:hypothetical protein n=1 Tax=Streptomyces sp. NPDC046939 TaxID=3155376 RepID=UPI0033C68A5B